MPDKGKVERFIGYLKRSFWVPFVASMRQVGLKPDKHAANAAVARWLREVANARVHASTNEIPAELSSWRHRSCNRCRRHMRRAQSDRCAPPGKRKAIIGYQHPLSVYDALFLEVLP